MRFSLEVIETGFNGTVLWRGNSNINGKPIVLIAVGLKTQTTNTKTGNFIQTYILSDEENSPTEALNNGKDEAICGNCIHRKVNGWGTCYVNVGQGPNQVYRSYKNNSYPDCTPEMINKYFSGRLIRLGAYGDPAAVPFEVWRKILEVATGWTGYTHQWRKSFAQEFKNYLMASVETVSQQKKARAKGWKTFRVRNEDEPLQPHEFICPASAEAGKKRQCETCLACCGGEWNGKQATPTIVIHGQSYKPVRFNKMQRLMRAKKQYRKLLPSLIGIGSSKGKGTGILTNPRNVKNH